MIGWNSTLAVVWWWVVPTWPQVAVYLAVWVLLLAGAGGAVWVAVRGRLRSAVLPPELVDYGADPEATVEMELPRSRRPRPHRTGTLCGPAAGVADPSETVVMHVGAGGR